MATFCFIVCSYLYSLVFMFQIKIKIKIMSCPMFMYGLTVGSIIPLTIVYMIRPESLTNLFDFLSSSFLIAFNFSEGVAQRFNLSNDLFFPTNQNSESRMKTYSCYTIEFWYNIVSWIIYICFILSLILF